MEYDIKAYNIYYNSKYNLDILIKIHPQTKDEILPVFVNHDTGKVYKPFLKRSNTKLLYPMINLANYGEPVELVYCHKIVAFSILSKTEYARAKSRLQNQNGDYIVVDHKSGNTFDYSPENLRYLTNSENVKHVGDYMKPTKEQYKNLKCSKFVKLGFDIQEPYN